MQIKQGDESDVKVVILDDDGHTVHNVKRTVRNVVNHGWYKTGEAKIDGKIFNLTYNNNRWFGNAYDYKLKK